MSTPYDRAKPPHPTVPEIHGCHVCGADPTHFAPGGKAVVPLCDGCDAVGLATAASFGAAVVFAVPVPAPLFALVVMAAGLMCMCWWSSH